MLLLTIKLQITLGILRFICHFSIFVLRIYCTKDCIGKIVGSKTNWNNSFFCVCYQTDIQLVSFVSDCFQILGIGFYFLLKFSFTFCYANKGPVKAMVFPVVIYGCESWTLKKVKGCCWTIRCQDSWPPEETNSIQGQRRGWIAQSFCVIKFY